MVNELALSPQIAGMDTTTGHGADSFFLDNVRPDPWADTCIENLIDIVINHTIVVFPTPSKKVRDEIPDDLLPLTFAEGRKRQLLKVKHGISADQIDLSPDCLDEEYQRFVEWAYRNTEGLDGWLTYHKTAPRITKSHNIFVPKHHVDEYLKQHNDEHERISRQLQISPPDITYAFDAFARRAQYQQLLRESTPYFSHPIRDRALRLSDRQLRTYQTHGWSWGRCLVRFRKHSPSRYSINWVFDRVCRIRELVQKHDATWYSLSNRPRSERDEVLLTIAADSDLPAKLKDSTRRKLERDAWIGGGVSATIGAYDPKLGALVATVPTTLAGFLKLVTLNRGYVPMRLDRLSVFKGHLDYPGLFSDK